MTPRDRFKMLLYLAQEIVLDMAGKGQAAQERAFRNAQFMRDHIEAWVLWAGWDPELLMREVHGRSYKKMMQRRKK